MAKRPRWIQEAIEAMMNEYDDASSACEDASARFRIYHAELDAAAVTRDLGIQPTESYRRAWILRTAGAVSSPYIRCHLDWLIDQLEPGREVIEQLQAAGCEMEVYCWGRWGQGIPSISPRNMLGLGQLGIKLVFNVYSLPEDDETEETPLEDALNDIIAELVTAERNELFLARLFALEASQWEDLSTLCRGLPEESRLNAVREEFAGDLNVTWRDYADPGSEYCVILSYSADLGWSNLVIYNRAYFFEEIAPHLDSSGGPR